MKPSDKNRLLKVAGISFVVVVGSMIYFSNQSGNELEDYVQLIEEKRSDADQFMRTGNGSPFTDSLLADYDGLKYYAPNPNYRVQAVIRKIEAEEYLIIPTSDGKRERYRKYANAEFKISGERHQLLLLKPVGFGQKDIIFTAFADATSGEDTYGGGRYLDLSFKNARQITIDFNLAYNPYCAYNASFSCPLPPKENILSIPILAGEKNYD